MPKWAKLLLILASVLGATGIVALFDKNWAWGILWGFGRSEAAMLHWMGVMKLSQFWAVIMAILFSSGSIIFQFMSGSEGGRFFRWLLNPLLIPLRKQFNIQVHFLPRQNGNGYAHSRKSARILLYAWLPVFLIEPVGGVLSSVIFSTSSGLNLKIACGVVLIANIVEKILWSYFVKWLIPYIQPFIVPIVCISLGVAITVAFLKLLYTEEKTENEIAPI